MKKIATSAVKFPLIFFIIATILTGCAYNANNPTDPYESYNRKMFKFNRVFDKFTLQPIATIYTKVTPKFLRKGIRNALSNVGQVFTVANDLLQAKVGYALQDSWRIAVNSTVGIAGIFDPATKLGLRRHHEDFGLTLARWGVKRSSYLMLPILGPSTVRDTFGIGATYLFSPYLSVFHYLKPNEIRYAATALNAVSVRAVLLPVDKRTNAAPDPYVFVRNAYLSRRNPSIHGKSSRLNVRKDYLSYSTTVLS